MAQTIDHRHTSRHKISQKMIWTEILLQALLAFLTQRYYPRRTEAEAAKLQGKRVAWGHGRGAGRTQNATAGVSVAEGH